MKENDFPDKQLANASHIHNLAGLIGVAGLKQKLQENERADEDFKLNWAVANKWSEQIRYVSVVEESTAIDFFEAITSNETGTLIWLKNWW